MELCIVYRWKGRVDVMANTEDRNGFVIVGDRVEFTGSASKRRVWVFQGKTTIAVVTCDTIQEMTSGE